MAGSISSYTFRVSDGRYEEALSLFREMKSSVEELGAKSARLLYAAVAGEATDTMVFTVEHASASDAGAAADKAWAKQTTLALSHKATEANSPISLVFAGVYENVDL